MSNSPCIQCRVPPDTKRRLSAVARQQQTSESGLLRRIVETALLSAAGTSTAELCKPVEQVPPGARVYVRLRLEDHILLRERAAARAMPAATYASIVLRSHLRGVSPLPEPEFKALTRAISELGAIGRNLNQIARVANETGRVNGPSRDDLRGLLKACEGLRDSVKALVNANTASWETGNAQARD